VWYSLWGDASVDAGDKGVTRTLTAPLGDVPVHARGGKILPMQRPALLTRDVRNSPLRLMVHLTRQVRPSEIFPLWLWQQSKVLRSHPAATMQALPAMRVT
jgi:alpha-glucosidase (family GH31 glycosyl hydrolase)